MAQAWKHRQFRSLVKAFRGICCRNDLGRWWVNRGKVLDRFMELLPAVRMFLEEKARSQLLAHLVNYILLHNTGFLTYIRHHLNSLNLKSQASKGFCLH